MLPTLITDCLPVGHMVFIIQPGAMHLPLWKSYVVKISQALSTIVCTCIKDRAVWYICEETYECRSFVREVWVGSKSMWYMCLLLCEYISLNLFTLQNKYGVRVKIKSHCHEHITITFWEVETLCWKHVNFHKIYDTAPWLISWHFLYFVTSVYYCSYTNILKTAY